MSRMQFYESPSADSVMQNAFTQLSDNLWNFMNQHTEKIQALADFLSEQDSVYPAKQMPSVKDALRQYFIENAIHEVTGLGLQIFSNSTSSAAHDIDEKKEFFLELMDEWCRVTLGLDEELHPEMDTLSSNSPLLALALMLQKDAAMSIRRIFYPDSYCITIDVLSLPENFPRINGKIDENALRAALAAFFSGSLPCDIPESSFRVTIQ